MPIYDFSKPFKVQSFNEYVKVLQEKKKTVKLDIQTKQRSLDQNALYWVWMKAIEIETGNTKEEMHLLYRANFLPKTDEYITKIIIPELWERTKTKIQFFHYFKGLENIIDIISESTTSQGEKEMSHFMDNVKDHALNSMGIILVKKGEKEYIDFLNEYSKRY